MSLVAIPTVPEKGLKLRSLKKSVEKELEACRDWLQVTEHFIASCRKLSETITFGADQGLESLKTFLTDWKKLWGEKVLSSHIYLLGSHRESCFTVIVIIKSVGKIYERWENGKSEGK